MGRVKTTTMLAGALALALALAGFAVLPRLRLSRAKYPSLEGHARWSRRLSRLLGYFEYTDAEWFRTDGAPADVEARRRANGAVYVRDRPAGAADHVVVVVADPGLVTGHGAGRLDAPEQVGGGQGVQAIVNGLVGDLGQIPADSAQDRVRARVRVGVHRTQHRHPGPGHPQPRAAQQPLEVHARSLPPVLE